MSDEKKDPGLPGKLTQGFGINSMERSSELAATQAAVTAKTEIEADRIMAIKNPRNEADARAGIIATCKNPTFAKKARYRKPTGKKLDERTNTWIDTYAVGPSIRFAEEAIRHWRNMHIQQTTIYDDANLRAFRITARDLERMNVYSSEIVIEKKVERRNNTDRITLGERVNARGQKVYIVVATEDEVFQKQSALTSKQIRNNSLRLIPDYIIEDAMAQVTATLSANIKQDPDAERKRLADGFMEVGVRPSELESYLRKPYAQASVEEMVELSEILTSIKDGQASWNEYIRTEVREEERERQHQQDEIATIQDGLKKQQGDGGGRTAPQPAPTDGTQPAPDVSATQPSAKQTVKKASAPKDPVQPVTDNQWADFRIHAFEEGADLLDQVKQEEGVTDLRKVKDSETRRRVIEAYTQKQQMRSGRA